MASPVIRARVAPIALVVALAFVVVGFFRADREMIRAERDSVSLMASGTATLIELFVLRQLSQLEMVKRLVDDHGQDSVWLADTVPALTARPPQFGVQFDELWLTGRSVQYGSSLHPRWASLVDTTDLKTVLETRSDSEQILVVKGYQGRHFLLFVESIHGALSGMIVGMISADSLTTFLQRQKRPRAVGIIVRVSSDTIVTILPLVPNKQQRDLEQIVAMPAAGRWVVTMTYTPTGRGARIALWVVGLGAIVGLGIGLILERREASRIADRSSELEHLSTELLRANRAKSEFLANVSHELRTPLNAIVGFVDLLRDGVYGPLNLRQAGPVERIEASANHLRHLVDQVLDLAKMAAGRLEVHTEPVELRPFVFDVASEVEPLMTEKGLSFSLAVGASLPRIRTDPTHLRQILINLLGNAVKFTASGGISVRGKLVTRSNQVEVGNRLSASDLLNPTARSESHWVALQVVDSGIGIPEKDHERIFDEFEQVNAGPRGDSIRRGTGLGLSISRRLARLLGGDITVESEVGRGSVFTVWLPVDPADFRGGQAA
jgi:signal transduction histidine kinase